MPGTDAVPSKDSILLRLLRTVSQSGSWGAFQGKLLCEEDVRAGLRRETSQFRGIKVGLARYHCRRKDKVACGDQHRGLLQRILLAMLQEAGKLRGEEWQTKAASAIRSRVVPPRMVWTAEVF
jgi:hypothetical protein